MCFLTSLDGVWGKCEKKKTNKQTNKQKKKNITSPKTEGGVEEKKARTACSQGPGIKPWTSHTLDESQQLHTIVDA